MEQAKTIAQSRTDYAPLIEQLAFDYRTAVIGNSRILHADCFEWLSRIPENSIHAIVTDPPYGVEERPYRRNGWPTIPALNLNPSCGSSFTPHCP